MSQHRNRTILQYSYAVQFIIFGSTKNLFPHDFPGGAYLEYDRIRISGRQHNCPHNNKSTIRSRGDVRRANHSAGTETPVEFQSLIWIEEQESGFILINYKRRDPAIDIDGNIRRALGSGQNKLTQHICCCRQRNQCQDECKKYVTRHKYTSG